MNGPNGPEGSVHGVGGTHPLSLNLLWPCGFIVIARVLDKNQEQGSISALGDLTGYLGESPSLLIRTEVDGGLGLCIARKETDTGLELLARVTGPGAI